MKNSTTNPTSQLIQNLLSAVQDPEGLKPPLLKKLYHLFVHLSLYPAKFSLRDGADSACYHIATGQYRIKVSFEDICSLSDILFKELLKVFKLFVYAFHDDSASCVSEKTSLGTDLLPTVETLNLLIRCCMVLMILLIPDQHHLLEDGKVLLIVLGVICSLNINQASREATIIFEKFTREYKYDDADCITSSTEELVASLHFLEPVDPCLPQKCRILEVIVDELLVHGRLRGYFKLIDSLSDTSDKLFMSHSSYGDLESVIQVICTHFCLSFSDDKAFEDFLLRLSFVHGKDCRAPELGLTAALVLLHNPFMLSAPKILQAHLYSLVSESITSIGRESTRADARQMDCYMSAFERSVHLYVHHMSSLRTKNHPSVERHSLFKSNRYQENCQATFENSIKPETRKKVDHVISKLDDSWKSKLHSVFWKTKSDLGTSSIAYVMEGQHILDISSRDEILSLVSSIILEVVPEDANYTTLNGLGNASHQDICLLASILKLMSCSLFQIVWCLRHNVHSGCLKTLKDFSSCEAHDSIVGIVSCFQQFSISLPVQESLRRIFEVNSLQHKESKAMLLHFMGLLSLSFSTGLDFLVRGCLSMTMVLLNLLTFEEVNLDSFDFDDTVNFVPPTTCSNNFKEGMVDRKSIRKVACKFQKIQKQYLSTFPVSNESRLEETSISSSVQKDSHSAAGIEETEEICNGEVYLRCILEGRQLPPDFHELADFVECKKGKDYSSWLKDKRRYRKRKCEKMAVVRWKKKKSTWKMMKDK